MPLVKFYFVVGLVLLDLQFARRKLRFLICCLHEGRRRAETLSVVTFGIKFRHRKRTFQILPFILLSVNAKHPNMCAFKQLTVAKD